MPCLNVTDNSPDWNAQFKERTKKSHISLQKTLLKEVVKALLPVAELLIIILRLYNISLLVRFSSLESFGVFKQWIKIDVFNWRFKM